MDCIKSVRLSRTMKDRKASGLDLDRPVGSAGLGRSISRWRRLDSQPGLLEQAWDNNYMGQVGESFLNLPRDPKKLVAQAHSEGTYLRSPGW